MSHPRCSRSGRGWRRLPALSLPAEKFDLVELLVPDQDPRTGLLRHKFETRRDVRTEDKVRIKSLEKWISAKPKVSVGRPGHPFSQKEARQLILALRQAVRHPSMSPATFASSTFMRAFRLRYCGAVLRALRRVPPMEVLVITAVPPKAAFPGDNLAQFDPRKFLGQLRAQLNRLGLRSKSGWLIAFVHGDYDPGSDSYQPHYHILAVGEKALVVDALRNLPSYRPAGYVKRPVQKVEIKNPPRQLSYHLAQAFWPQKLRMLINGQMTRIRTRGRIPFPRHAEVLMWFDRWDFEDLVWLNGCRIVKGRIVPTIAPGK